MLRELAAIGLSRYTGQMDASALVSRILQDRDLKGYGYRIGNEQWVDILYDMGPFQFVMRGKVVGPHSVSVGNLAPALKEKRGYMLGKPEIRFSEEGVLLIGQEAMCMEEVAVRMTESHRFYREKELQEQESLFISIYGLSIEGKILLGSFRSDEDQKAIAEEEQWRREMLERADSGDEFAIRAIEQEERFMDEEIAERLRREDVYTIFDGFMYPAGREENYYTILGDIVKIDKLFNPYSEEWVYYLELNVLGQELRVLINPTDLLGEPAVGRRFQGKVRLYGRLDPARMILENLDQFF